jgi:hypothetical protein
VFEEYENSENLRVVKKFVAAVHNNSFRIVVDIRVWLMSYNIVKRIFIGKNCEIC